MVDESPARGNAVLVIVHRRVCANRRVLPDRDYAGPVVFGDCAVSVATIRLSGL